MTSDAPKEVDVQFSSNCNDNNSGTCSNVHVGDVLDFTATIDPRECFSDGKPKVFKIHPEALEQSLVVELQIICECLCSSNTSSTYEERAVKCNGQGDLKCGVCSCLDGRFGNNCQCDNAYGQSENITQCIMEGSNVVCSGSEIMIRKVFIVYFIVFQV